MSAGNLRAQLELTDQCANVDVRHAFPDIWAPHLDLGLARPIESEELNSLFVLTADIEPEPTIAKTNLALGLSFPSLVQPNPVPRLLCVRDGKSQRKLTASKIGSYSPRSLLKISMECRNTRILGDGKPSPSARRPLTERFCALRFLADSRRSVFQQAPRELRRIRCRYDEISDLNQLSCTGTVANIIQQLGNIRRVALQVCRIDFHSV